MTSIPVLFTSAHRLFNALLMEARAAMDEGDWTDAQTCLAELALRLETHMHVEETQLFPRLEGQGPEVDAKLAQCRREHEDVRVHVRTVLAVAGARDRGRYATSLVELFKVLSQHCQAEEDRLYSLTDGMCEETLAALAFALSGAGDDEGPPGSIPPTEPRVH